MSKPTRLQDKDVIKTFRVLLATCIQQYGKFGTLTLSRAALEAAGDGTLSVTDKPDGSIVLKIKHARAMILRH